jgi:hypothetical protein
VTDGHVRVASPVEFEWVGARGRLSLEGTQATRGQRVTSSDAFMVARLRSARLRGYLMEWKYVEDGSERDKSRGDEGQERLRRYHALFRSVFRSGLKLDHFLVEPVYQLVRLCLLARKIVDDCQLDGVASVRTVLVCPRANKMYRDSRPMGRIHPSRRALLPIGRQFAHQQAACRRHASWFGTRPLDDSFARPPSWLSCT